MSDEIGATKRAESGLVEHLASILTARSGARSAMPTAV